MKQVHQNMFMLELYYMYRITKGQIAIDIFQNCKYLGNYLDDIKQLINFNKKLKKYTDDLEVNFEQRLNELCHDKEKI